MLMIIIGPSAVRVHRSAVAAAARAAENPSALVGQGSGWDAKALEQSGWLPTFRSAPGHHCEDKCLLSSRRSGMIMAIPCRPFISESNLANI